MVKRVSKIDFAAHNRPTCQKTTSDGSHYILIYFLFSFFWRGRDGSSLTRSVFCVDGFAYILLPHQDF